MRDLDRSLPGDDLAPSDDDLLLQRSLDGELRPSERIEFEERLETDADLRARLDDLIAMRAMRQSIRPRGGLGLDFADRVMAQCQTSAGDAVPQTAVPQTAVPQTAGPESAVLSNTDLASEAASKEPLPAKFGSWLERGILIAAAIFLALGISLMVRQTPEPKSLSASEDRAEILRKYDESWAEKERLLRLERESKDREDENGSASDTPAGKGR